MSELRWNPLLGTWTMVASNRKLRPNMPKDWCPFCPGEGKKVPSEFTVYAYDNDFPALTQHPEAPYWDGGFYKSAENYGKCEVILYSPRHNVKFYDLSVAHIVELLDLIADRCTALSADKRIKYVYPFENKGEAVGVTMPHPHGQIYGYPFVPQKIETELHNCKAHYEKRKRCLLCQMTEEEKDSGKRIVAENDSFVAYIPFFTDYPYGVFVVSKRHLGMLSDCTAKEREDLARILKVVTQAFDELFKAPFPYMMVYHQRPVNSPEYNKAKDYYHFHIEFYPPFREANKIKYYASSEMGAWAAANTSAVEETAPVLRQLVNQILEKEDMNNE
ncbi:galactose-1-phosphate uridylyltransferase [Veillonella criceti]|uniref:Galactose-1-phosphate uridylyltransferase n=1 Tax=Veillonella criceti TaxID=103891 RepID=A0A380NKY1_9FIRM|nr:galactose-1-phosphate uridylyltransferase [Veillonella criceti]SUP43299.1 Galactose-1-phosphate uridylyltransferase [Veillonella criceti]